MCLVLFSYRPGTDRPLVVAANRDEFYARPARGAHLWEDAADVVGGRDLEAGGAWLGISRHGRFATVTNFAEDAPGEEAPASRGALVTGFLTGVEGAHDYAASLHGPDYRGFNLLLFDGSDLVYTSNRGVTRTLDGGTYGLANAELGAAWPKVTRGVAALADGLGEEPHPDRLIALLADDTVPADEDLPRRGRPIELERRVAPCFIRGDAYGTRASTAVILSRDQLVFAEQAYEPGGVPSGRVDITLERT